MGKFGIPLLKKPEDLISLFNSSISKISVIRSDLHSQALSSTALYKIDEISNLCSITSDTSTAISELFPSEPWKLQAFDVQDKMIDVFTELNHDKSISELLDRIKSDPLIWKSLNHSEKYFTGQLIQDLAKESFGSSETSINIQRLQFDFIQNIRQGETTLPVLFSELESIPSQFRPDRPDDKFPEVSNISFTKPSILQTLTYCSSPTLRPKLFTGLNNLASENRSILDTLIKQRNKASRSQGYQNFSHFALSHQAFPTQPDSLISKLKSCFALLEGKLQNEYSVLLDRKALEEQVSRQNPVSLYPSDFAYYLQKYLNSKMLEKFPNYSSFHLPENYFTVYNILEGFKALLFVQFSINAEIEICPLAETWSNDIIKLSLFSKGSKIGVLYLDLFQRANKSSAPAAKFNIMCGRGASGVYPDRQIPTVVVSTNFIKSRHASSSLQMDLTDLHSQGVNFPMLQELYHELGHALHSISSKSEFQTYSGTRVPVDLAEIPSHVFELFVTDYEFVKTWAIHKDRKEVIPEELFEYLLGRSKEFPALNRHGQLGIALFDLYLHTSESVEEAVHKFEEQHKCKEFVGNWFCSIEHFVEYASCYYSYILDEAISHVVWETVYNRKVFNDKAGKAIMQEVLEKGGSVEPQVQINNLFKPFLIKDQMEGSDVDTFYLMEFWFKKFFADTQMVSLEKLRAENRVFYK